jgi:Ca2+-binding RTX toxin-like protein
MATATARQAVDMNVSHDVLDTGLGFSTLISAGLDATQTIWSAGTAGFLEVIADFDVNPDTGVFSGSFSKIELQTGPGANAPIKWTLTNLDLAIGGQVVPMGENYNVTVDVPGLGQAVATVTSDYVLLGEVEFAFDGPYPTLAEYVLRNADNMTGSSGNDVVFGYGGNDTINGAKGNDQLDGGAGADRIFGGDGNDTMVWGTGDILNGGAGAADAVKLNASLNLVKLANDKIINVETANMTGGGNETLTLGKDDVLKLSTTTDILTVLGDAGDTVDLRGTFVLNSTADGFEFWKLGAATVKIDTDLTVL